MNDILNDQYSHLRNQAAAYVTAAKDAADAIEQIYADEIFARGGDQDMEWLEILVDRVATSQQELDRWAARINERALSVAWLLGKRDA